MISPNDVRATHKLIINFYELGSNFLLTSICGQDPTDFKIPTIPINRQKKMDLKSPNMPPAIIIRSIMHFKEVNMK